MHVHPLSFLIATLLFCGLAPAAAYDPLAVADERERQPTVDLQVHDARRNREIPIRTYLPAAREPAPVVLFSHGLGGSRQGNRHFAEHWAARGYVVVMLQHPGSNTSVWKDVPARERMAAMQSAASGENLVLRVDDVRAVIDQIERWNTEKGHELAGRIDMQRVGMSGHSFGAVTTQAVSGQSYGPAGVQRFTDRRIKAAIAFSPSSPRAGDPKRAFASVQVPWMLMTGTNDTSPIGGQTVESRLAVYPLLPAALHKYELVLSDAEHSAFTDRPLPGDTKPRNPNHTRAILALSTAFWDAHLRGDADARDWLHGAAARAVLEETDRWQCSPAKPPFGSEPQGRSQAAGR